MLVLRLGVSVIIRRYVFQLKQKVKWSRYRPGVVQRVGRVIALLFHDRGTRRVLVFSSTPRPHFTPGKDPVPNLQEVGWAPGSVWTGGKSRPHRDSIPDRSVESQWGRDFPPVQTDPGAHPTSCKMGTGSFPGVKCGRGVLLTTSSAAVMEE